MRILTKREHEALHEFLDEIAEQVKAARRTIDAARKGSILTAHVELDFTRSQVAEITEAAGEIGGLAELIDGYLDRLVTSTAEAQPGNSMHGYGSGLVPPRRTVYTIDEGPDDLDDTEPAEPAGEGAEVAA